MRLFLGNLPYDASEDELKAWFAKAGVGPLTISIERDRFSGQPRGFGSAEFATDADALRAIRSCNGQEFKGRTILVSQGLSTSGDPPPSPRRSRTRGKRRTP